MEQTPETNVPQKNQRIFWIFYIAAIFLLIGAIAASFTKRHYWIGTVMTKVRQMQRQKDIREQRESSPAVIAAAEVDVQPLFRQAAWWGRLSVAALILAILSCGIARRHDEKQRWVWVPVIVLLTFYILVEVFLL